MRCPITSSTLCTLSPSPHPLTISATGVPPSVCRRAKATCSCANRFSSPALLLPQVGILTALMIQSESGNGVQNSLAPPVVARPSPLARFDYGDDPAARPFGVWGSGAAGQETPENKGAAEPQRDGNPRAWMGRRSRGRGKPSELMVRRLRAATAVHVAIIADAAPLLSMREASSSLSSTQVTNWFALCAPNAPAGGGRSFCLALTMTEPAARLRRRSSLIPR